MKYQERGRGRISREREGGGWKIEGEDGKEGEEEGWRDREREGI